MLYRLHKQIFLNHIKEELMPPPIHQPADPPKRTPSFVCEVARPSEPPRNGLSLPAWKLPGRYRMPVWARCAAACGWCASPQHWSRA
jgi:hypothetical protein